MTDWLKEYMDSQNPIVKYGSRVINSTLPQPAPQDPPNLTQVLDAGPQALGITQNPPVQTMLSGLPNIPGVLQHTDQAMPQTVGAGVTDVPVAQTSIQQQQPQIYDLGKGGGARAQWVSGISPTAQKGFEGAFDATGEAQFRSVEDQKAAQQRANEAYQQRLSETQQETAGQLGAAQGQMLALKDAAEKIQSVKEQSDLDVDNATKAVAGMKADPNRFYHDRTTMDKIALGLGTAMGAFVSGFTGGPNQAAKIVDDAIARDLHAQEDDISNARSTSDTALRRNLKITGDLDKARELTRIQMIEVAKHQAQLLSLGNQGAMAQAGHEKLMAALDASKDEFQANLLMREAELRAKTDQKVIVGGGVGGGFGELSKTSKDDNERYVPALGGLAPNAKTAGELNDKAGSLQSMIASLNRAATIRKQMGVIEGQIHDRVALTRNKDYLELQAQANKALTEANTIMGQGVISGKDEPRTQKMLGSIGDFSIPSDAAAATAQAMANTYGQQYKDLAKTANITPANVVQYRDQYGVIHKVYQPTGQLPGAPTLQGPTVPQEPITDK